MSFEEAHEYIMSLGLKGSREWYDWRKSPARHPGIPINPQRYYAGGGWKGMTHWLTGVEKPRHPIYMSFKDAQEFVRQLGLRSAEQWRRYCRAGMRPETIPAAPYKVYKEWEGWKGWLGEVVDVLADEKLVQ